MNRNSRSGAARLALAGAASCLGVTFAAGAAPTDIELWHALNGHDRQVFEKLVKNFNGQQQDVKVRLKAYDSPEAVESALAAPKAKPTANLVHLVDYSDPVERAARKHIMPLHALLAKNPVKNVHWFLPPTNTYVHDERNRLVAFPYMAEIPVMYYNLDAFKKAGISPARPSRSWPVLQDQLVQLANNGSRSCPLANDQPVSVNLENLAAINKQPFATGENGLRGKGKPAFLFDVVYVRHLSIMVSWVRSGLMVRPAQDANTPRRFSEGECAVLMSGSGQLGQFKSSKGLHFAVSGLPYYPELTADPGNPFVQGSAFWAVSGHSAAQDKATAAFLSWLAQPDNAAYWFQNTGYLPLTKEAFDATPASYYEGLGAWRDIVAVYATQPAPAARGFRIGNYAKIRPLFRDALDRALNGEQPAVLALKSATAEADKLAR